MFKAPREVFRELKNIQKSFLWKTSAPKIKHKPWYKNYRDDSLKNVDIPQKVVSLQWSWILLYLIN